MNAVPPAARAARTDLLILTIFMSLGQIAGVMFLGLAVAGLDGMFGLPFYFALGMGLMPETALAIILPLGIAPAAAAGLAAVLARRFGSAWLYLAAPVFAGCGALGLAFALSPIAAEPQHREELFLAAAVAAALCAVMTLRARR